MPYTLREAAEAAGKGKPAILKAIQSGKISAEKDTHGEWRIEPAELHRVYPPVSGDGLETHRKEAEETLGTTNGSALETGLLQQELAFLREKLAGAEQMREDERRSLSDRIEELRRDRDDLRGERDKLLEVVKEQATGVKLLTDQRKPESPPQVPMERSAGWRRALARIIGG